MVYLGGNISTHHPDISDLCYLHSRGAVNAGRHLALMNSIQATHVRGGVLDLIIVNSSLLTRSLSPLSPLLSFCINFFSYPSQDHILLPISQMENVKSKLESFQFLNDQMGVHQSPENLDHHENDIRGANSAIPLTKPTSRSHRNHWSTMR